MDASSFVMWEESGGADQGAIQTNYARNGGIGVATQETGRTGRSPVAIANMESGSNLQIG
eukprot:2882004-Karenia_brevis.AAC.1